MSEYLVGAEGAVVLNEAGDRLVQLQPGTRISGRLDILAEPPKMRGVRSDKQRRAGRDYEAPEMAAHEDKQA